MTQPLPAAMQMFAETKRKVGRPRGSRNPVTRLLIERLQAYKDAGLDLPDALIGISEDRSQPWELRLVAMRHLLGALLAKLGPPPVR
jgi:hypothetical protein